MGFKSQEHKTDGKEETVVRTMTRSQRLMKRFKNCLRCEWCNRWTEVSPKKWQKLRSEEKLFPCKYLFYCAREKCRADRAEILDMGVK